ncbi:hypothetical protein K443DRAFT_633524, partial [Laccaria amethystina LaAM-08-1]
IDRAAFAIFAAKAFNAAPHEHSRVNAAFHWLGRAAGKLSTVWRVTSMLGYGGDVLQGFWFSPSQEDNISAGDVVAVFWA